MSLMTCTHIFLGIVRMASIRLSDAGGIIEELGSHDTLFSLFSQYREQFLAQASEVLASASDPEKALAVIREIDYPSSREDFIAYLTSLGAERQRLFVARLRRGFAAEDLHSERVAVSGYGTEGFSPAALVQSIAEQQRDSCEEFLAVARQVEKMATVGRRN